MSVSRPPARAPPPVDRSEAVTGRPFGRFEPSAALPLRLLGDGGLSQDGYGWKPRRSETLYWSLRKLYPQRVAVTGGRWPGSSLPRGAQCVFVRLGDYLRRVGLSVFPIWNALLVSPRNVSLSDGGAPSLHAALSEGV